MRSHRTLSRTPRFGAAALAVGITAALLSALDAPQNRRLDGWRGAVMVWLPAPAPPAALPAPGRLEKRQALPPKRRQDSSGSAHSAAGQLFESPATVFRHAPEPGGSPAPIVEGPRSAPPLNLELSGAAARAATSPLRSLAEKAGTYMGDVPLSEQARLAQAVNRARKPDCLAANERGSLLSLFKIGYDAVTDKCK